VISEYLGKNWGIVIGFCYFLMMVIGVITYSLAITNDSASYLYSYNVTGTLLSKNPFYGLALLIIIVFIAFKSEKVLFRVAGFMAISVILIVGVMGVLIIPSWSMSNISSMPPVVELIRGAIITLPFSLTSIIFIQSLSPMVIAYRAKYESKEIAKYKSQRAMKISFIILAVVVFFFAISSTFAVNQTQALGAFERNISFLALIADHIPGTAVNIMGVALNIFAVTTSFLGVLLAFHEGCSGLIMNVLRRKMPEERVNRKLLSKCVIVFTVLLGWAAILSNVPILYLTSIISPIFGIVGCLVPALLVYKIPALHKYRDATLIIIMIVGFFLCLSPILAFSQ
jgi:amino acid permease